MTIGGILRYKDRHTYKRLMQLYRVKADEPKKKIELGCSIESLMKVDSYERRGRRVNQKTWG